MMVNGRMIRKKEKANNVISIGTFNYPHDENYYGQWGNDMKNGEGKYMLKIGIYKYSNDDKYDVEWKDDVRIGQGIG